MEHVASTAVVADHVADVRFAKRAARASLMGTAIEYYEFGAYGYLAALFAPLFFPSGDPTISLLSALAVFGTSFLIRPLGGIVLGHVGDRVGRKSILILTIAGMGIATAAIGLLPTHATLGLAAPLLLLLCRLAQGFFAGGEASGATAYVSESAPPGRRGYYTAFVPAGAALGGGSAAIVAGVTSLLLSSEDMQQYGWRIPFLVSVPLVVVAFLIRRKLEETPQFQKLKASDQVERSPLFEILRYHYKACLKLIGLGFGMTVGYWVGIVYMGIYMGQYLGYNQTFVLFATASMGIVAGLLTPLGGLFSDRFGRKRTLLIGFVGYAVLVFPVMFILNQHVNMALAAIVLLGLTLPFPFCQSAAYAVYAEVFPTRNRYTGVALSLNIATILGAGLSPYLATWLIGSTGSNYMPGVLLMVGCVLALLTLLTLREGAGKELQQ